MGKPAFTYELTEEAERLFPKAYGLILLRVLDELARREDPGAVEGLLRQVGLNLAAEYNSPEGAARDRMEAGASLLNELGGMAVLEERDGQYFIRGYGCPLAAIVPDHPQACRLAETLLSAYTGLPVRECCQRQEPPQCLFHVQITE